MAKRMIIQGSGFKFNIKDCDAIQSFNGIKVDKNLMQILEKELPKEALNFDEWDDSEQYRGCYTYFFTLKREITVPARKILWDGESELPPYADSECQTGMYNLFDGGDCDAVVLLKEHKATAFIKCEMSERGLSYLSCWIDE
jgi:hypothetical protein